MDLKQWKQSSNEKEKARARRTARALSYVLVVLLGALVIVLTLFFTTLSEIRAEEAPETPHVDPEAERVLRAMDELDPGYIADEIRGLDERREAYASASESREAYARSYRESSERAAMESSEAESRSIAESIRESSIQASVEAQKQASMEATIRVTYGSPHLIPGQVVYNCDDRDIPLIRKLFRACIVVGNSRAKNIVDCGILTMNEVIYVSGKPASYFDHFVEEAARLHRPRILIILGLNDLGAYKSDSWAFKADYDDLINIYRGLNPNSLIFLQQILPVPDSAAPYFWRYKQIPVFDDRIRELASEKGCYFVSANAYADFKYINSQDQAHYSKDFYFLWAQTMANQMGLWGDLLGPDWTNYKVQ
ncbi:MAG: hypothetical protein IKG97_04880 [Lachnospiraceae bacterium]|nr:hypothetical protein [Lachnospiraceae bacterium]